MWTVWLCRRSLQSPDPQEGHEGYVVQWCDSTDEMASRITSLHVACNAHTGAVNFDVTQSECGIGATGGPTWLRNMTLLSVAHSCRSVAGDAVGRAVRRSAGGQTAVWTAGPVQSRQTTTSRSIQPRGAPSRSCRRSDVSLSALVAANRGLSVLPISTTPGS